MSAAGLKTAGSPEEEKAAKTSLDCATIALKVLKTSIKYKKYREKQQRPETTASCRQEPRATQQLRASPGDTAGESEDRCVELHLCSHIYSNAKKG